MAATTATEIGDLLFRNFDQHVDRTVHHLATIEKPNNFKDALEMYCYRNKIHKLQNPAALLYMIMGYLSTYPRKKRIGVKNIFLSRDEEMIKVLAQYNPAKAKNSVDLSPFYRAFVIYINPTTPPKRLDINDYESMEKILSIPNQNPYGYKSALKSALERVQYIVIKRPRIGTVYSVLTDEGTKMYLANKATPFVVETESAPLAATRDSIYKPYAMVSVQGWTYAYTEMMDNIPTIFKKAAAAHKLTSSPENLLFFVQGALEFNCKTLYNLKIRLDVQFFTNNYNRLFVQEVIKGTWVNDRPSMVIVAYRETDAVNQQQGGRVSIPSDFNSKFTTVDVVTYILSDQGPITQRKDSAMTANGGYLANDLYRIIESDEGHDRLLQKINAIIHRMEMDAEFFFVRNEQPPFKFFQNYILGQLLAYSGDQSMQVYSFKNAEISDNRVSFVLKRNHLTSGVAIHILEDPIDRSSTGTYLAPDYHEIGLTDKILNIYIDCRNIRLTQDFNKNHLSRLPANSISADYTSTHVSDNIDIMGDFQAIERDVQKYPPIYSLVITREDFISTIIRRAAKAGLGPKSSSELQILIKSFCLGAQRRATFLPFPEVDPSILGIRSINRLPLLLMKLAVDVRQNELLGDLRTVYIRDQRFMKKKQVILKVVSAASSLDAPTVTEFTTQEEYTDGINGPLYDMCRNNPSFGRFKRQSNDFCRKRRRDEHEDSLIEDTNQLSEMQNFEEIVQKSTTFRNNLEQHLGRVETFSNVLMHGTMAKNIVGALIDGNYKDVAINVGFLAGSTGLGYAAQYAARRGTTMVGEGSEIFGTSLRLASPFLNRVTSAFVAYDLYKQVEAYKSGQDDAMVGIATDSVVLTIDIAALAIETLEVLGLIGSISFAFGPIGAAVGAIIFVAVDIYQAVKTVEKIDSLIKLTTHERFEEGLLAFVHASPEKYILMKEKQLNNEQAKRSIEILSNMEQFQIHAAPSLKSCEPIKSLNICMNGVKEVENNVANFTRLGNFYSRTWPDTPNNFRVICADAGHKRQRLYPRLEYTIESWLSQGKTPKNEKLALECYSSEALFDSNLKKGTKAFLKAASGNDTIIGFRDRSNIISFAGGRKYFVGGAESDTFILHGEDVAMGFLDGGIGSDVLDFSKYAKKELQIQFYNGYKTAHILVVSGTNYRLDIDNIENFVGRPDAQDKMVTNCRTSFVDLQGGTEQLSDLINILQSQDQFCEYRLAVALWHNTHVMNQACSGTFSYELNKDSKSGLVYLKNYCKDNSTAQSIVKINMPLRAVSKMQRLVDDEQHQLEIPFENGILLSAVDFNLNQTHFLFEDFVVQVGTDGIIGMSKVPVIENPYDAIQHVMDLHHLNAVFVIADENNQTKITIGHGRLITNSQNPQLDTANVNVFHNDLNFEHSILVSGNDTENIFYIETQCNRILNDVSCRPIIATIYLENNKTSNYKDIIDLSDTYYAVKNIGRTLNVRIQSLSKNKIFVELRIMNQNILLGYLTIHNVDKNNIENQLIVILNVPFYFHSESDRFTLKPTPLSFTKETKVIILQPGDVAEFMSIKLSKTVDDFLTVLKSNETHLILTNMMNPNIKYDENNLFTIYLVDYYRSEANAHLFNSLQMEFNDGSTFNVGDVFMERKNDILDFEVFKNIVHMLLKM